VCVCVEHLFRGHVEPMCVCDRGKDRKNKKMCVEPLVQSYIRPKCVCDRER